MDRTHGAVSRFLFVCAAALGGCSTTPPRAVHTPAPPPAWRVAVPETPQYEELLQYIESVRSMPPAQLQQEAVEVDQSARRAPSVVNRLRLGMFLGFAPAPYRATARAQHVLDGVWRDESGPQRDVVRLLLAVLEDRQELEATLSDERRQRQALRTKLEQLKAIEEDMDRRIQPPIINPR